MASTSTAPSTILGGLRQKIRSVFREKRWHYFGISTEQVFISCVIVDGGYAGNAFVSVVDLQTGTVLKDASFLGVPRVSIDVNDKPLAGAMASFRQPGSSIELWRPERSTKYRVAISVRDLEVTAELDAKNAPMPLAVMGGFSEGAVAFTQKTNLMPVTGKARLRSHRFSLDGGFAALDYSAGQFPRVTEWRWGFGMGRFSDGMPFGFNLADGNNLGGQSENALWIGEDLVMIGEAQFFFDRKNVVAPWKIKTSDGALDLHFMPKGVHREERELLVVRSRFAQVLGLYSGIVKDPRTGKTREITSLPGVAEDQRVKW